MAKRILDTNTGSLHMSSGGSIYPQDWIKLSSAETILAGPDEALPAR